jgi:hypothetical protein
MNRHRRKLITGAPRKSGKALLTRTASKTTSRHVAATKSHAASPIGLPDNEARYQ